MIKHFVAKLILSRWTYAVVAMLAALFLLEPYTNTVGFWEWLSVAGGALILGLAIYFVGYLDAIKYIETHGGTLPQTTNKRSPDRHVAP